MSTNENKQHLSVVIAGHVDAGKSTSTGHLIFKLGGISEREMQKLQEEADRLGKGSFAFAFYMDKQKEERERGVTIQYTTKEFFTNNYHYTIIDAPGHRDFIKNMIGGAGQADVAVLMVPADGGFATSIQRGDHKANQVMGQTRNHALLLYLLGIKQLIICVNKMDSDTAKYSQERFEEVRDEMKSMLVKVGWPKMFVEKSVPIIPLSGYRGDNLIEKSTNMEWWQGQDVKLRSGKEFHVNTLLDALDKMVQVPPRPADKPLRLPVSELLTIKGVGDVATGRVEQGVVKAGDEVVFYPNHTEKNPCAGKVFSIEMHHKTHSTAGPGDNVGLNIKGLPKKSKLKGTVMVLKSDQTISRTRSFVLQAQILNHPGEIKIGYTPIVFARTARAACRVTKINWKQGKETGGTKQEDPPFVKSGDTVELVFEPQAPFVVDRFDNCEGLGRVAVLDGNSVIMLGRVMDVSTY